jgi:hypothetical protein
MRLRKLLLAVERTVLVNGLPRCTRFLPDSRATL